jgi:WD40 repeat protein/serine/threonine protein kinase
MARVYKAYQSSLDRYVAIKVLHSHLAGDKDFVERFEQEATAVARLRHPNIVQVYDYDSIDELYYIVMEFVEGPTLKAELSERIKRSTQESEYVFALDEIARIVTTLADAIDYAHSRGMIHRDLKPGNIMFTVDGQILLTDFGLARMVFATTESQTGALSGTPAYMAPEQVQGGHVDERSDVYSLGVILYELLTGRVPFHADTPYEIMTMHVTDEVPSLRSHNPDLPSAAELVVLQALSKDPENRYQTAGEMAGAYQDGVGVHIYQAPTGSIVSPIATIADSQEMMPISTHIGASVSILASLTSPYRGLYAFREEDSPYFFGRESFTDRLANTIKNQAMAAVIGPSGSGKSSVVYAGLIPRLRENELSHWSIVEMRPGSQPFKSLAGALVETLNGELTEEEQLTKTQKLATDLLNRQTTLADVLTQISKKNEKNGQQLLVVDQFEELYTLCSNESIQHLFPTVLFEAIKDSRDREDLTLTLVLTLRADFMGQALTDRPFADALQDADVKLGPMTRAELGRAIESPAAKKRVVFEAGLVDRILDDVGDEPGNLPLLEFALTLLWERRSGLRLTHSAYEAIGRVEGSLARYADEVYEQLTAEEQKQARRVFTQMVRPGEGTEDTRRLATRDELGEEDWHLAQRLADARLVVTSRGIDGQETVEVVHEALIRGWGRLLGWMNAERAFRSWQERLRVALRQWEDNARDHGALLRGAPLAEAKEWLDQNPENLSEAEKGFVQASIDLELQLEAERDAQRQRELDAAKNLADEQLLRAESEHQRAEEQTRSTRNLRSLAIILGIVFILAVIAAIYAVGESRIAAEQADARATEVVVRTTAESQAVDNARLAATRAAERLTAQMNAETERRRANEAADQAIASQDEAETERDRADDQARIALSRQLAAQSTTLLGAQYDLALLLALESDNINQSAESESSILSALQFNPNLITFLRGHDGLLQAVDFSPNGRWLASAGSNGQIFLWDVETNEIIREFLGHDPSQLVNRVRFNPDGTLLASASDDTLVILWDVETGEQLANFDGHDAWVQSVDFSPDGESLLSAGGDRRVVVWDLATGEQSLRLAGHTGPLWDAVFSSTGKYIGTASADGSAKIWDATTGEEIMTLTGHNGPVFNVAFDATDEVAVSAGGDGNLIKWDLQTGEQIGDPFIGHGAGAVDVAVSPDGTMLASSSADSTVRIWDFETGQQILLFGNHNGLVPSVDYSPDGGYLASGDVSGVAIVWDVNPAIQSMARTISSTGVAINDIAIHPSENLLAGAGADGQIRFWEPDTSLTSGQTITHAQRISEDIVSAAFDESGGLLATGSGNGTINVWDVETGENLLILSALTNGISSLDMADDSQLLLGTSPTGFSALWDLSTGNQIGPFLGGHIGKINASAISPDGQIFATAGEDGSLLIRAVSELQAGQGAGTPVSPLEYATNADISLESLAFSPDSSLVATGDNQGTVTLWSTALQDIVDQTNIGESAIITQVIFDSTGERILVADDGGAVWVMPADLSEHPEIIIESSGDPIAALSIDESGRIVTAVTATGLAYQRDRDTNELESEQLISKSEDFQILSISPKAQYVALTPQEGLVETTSIEFGDVETLQQPSELKHNSPFIGNINAISYSPDGRLMASSGADGSIVLWDAETRIPMTDPIIEHNSVVTSLAFSPDSQLIASGGCAEFHRSGNCIEGEVLIHDLNSGELIARLNDTVGFVQALNFSPDGNLLVANDCQSVEVAGVCLEGTLRLWNIADWSTHSILTGHTAFVWSAAFSPDSTVLASGSADNSIILWDVGTGEPIGQRLSNHGGPVRRVTFSPDGTRLASAGFDNLVFLWDVATGQSLGGPVATYTNNAVDVEFTPGLGELISSSIDGNVISSDVSLDSWREKGCSVTNRNFRSEEWELFFGEIPYASTCE